MTDQQTENTDREIWRATPGDYYSPSIFVTKEGAIGINVGGRVRVRDVRDWFDMADIYLAQRLPRESAVTEFPKPWRAYQDEDDWLLDANGKKIIVNLLGMDDLRMIAAAPDLLRLLEWSVDTLRARSPEVLGMHPEGSEAAALIASLTKGNQE